MPLNTSGPISLGGSTTGQSVNLELGRSATASISLGETDVRDLAGVSSGAISLSNLYGASAVSNYTIYQMVLTAGGGGGGRRTGGGGGAGGVHVVSNITLNLDTTYTITFGAGGAADTNGSDSVAFGYTAIGGGKGAQANTTTGSTGGSGGGSRASGYSLTIEAGGSGTSGQGNDGGDGQSKGFHSASGGGGGISGAGVDGNCDFSSSFSFVGGDGGDGNRVQWYGSTYNNYGAGGGGGSSKTGSTAGSGGQYGGGDGGVGSSGSANAGGNASSYTGSGGGGGGDGNYLVYNGGSGGSSLIIIRYNSPNTDLPDTMAGGVDRGVHNGYRVIQWTGSGSIRFNS